MKKYITLSEQSFNITIVAKKKDVLKKRHPPSASDGILNYNGLTNLNLPIV